MIWCLSNSLLGMTDYIEGDGLFPCLGTVTAHDGNRRVGRVAGLDSLRAAVIELELVRACILLHQRFAGALALRARQQWTRLRHVYSWLMFDTSCDVSYLNGCCLLCVGAGEPAGPHLCRGGHDDGAGGLVQPAGPHPQRPYSGQSWHVLLGSSTGSCCACHPSAGRTFTCRARRCGVG